MSRFRFSRVAFTGSVALLVVGLPVLADELRGTVKSIDRAHSRMVVHDDLAQRDVVVNFTKLTALKTKVSRESAIEDLKPGTHVAITDSITASKIDVEDAGS